MTTPPARTEFAVACMDLIGEPVHGAPFPTLLLAVEEAAQFDREHDDLRCTIPHAVVIRTVEPWRQVDRDDDCPRCHGTGTVSDGFEPAVNAWNSTDCDCVWQSCSWTDCFRKGDVKHDGQLVCAVHFTTLLAQERIRQAVA